MRLRYRIINCVRDQFAAVAEIAGKDQDVTIQGLVIEAVSEDGSMGHTFKLRGEPAELDAAFERAEEGADLFVTLEVGDPENDGARISLAHPLPENEAEADEPTAEQET